MQLTDMIKKRLHWSGALLTTILLVTLTGCFKDYKEDFLFRDAQVEIDIASKESNAPGKGWPVMPTYDKGSGTKTFQVNLIGGVKPEAQVIRFRAVPEESTAVEGLHYSLPANGTFEIPANSSTGTLSVNILDFPATSGSASLVLELVGNEQIKAAANYKRLGITISLTGPPAPTSALYPQLGNDKFSNTIAVDLMHPGLSADFKTQWNAMKTNLFAFSTGGRTPYGLQFRFGDNKQVRVTLVYTTTASLAFSYAYASWLYDFDANAQGTGRFVFRENLDANATSLYPSVMTPLLTNYLEKYEFTVKWVDAAIATARQGAQIGGLFRTDNATSFVFGELTYLSFSSNTPRPMPSSPAISTLFNNNNSGLFSSVLIDPTAAGQSADFMSRWNTAKSWVSTNSAGRILVQPLLVFDPQFNDVILVMAYTNATNAKLIAQTRYWLRMSHTGEMTLEYIHRDANATATNPPSLFADYFNSKTFVVTRNGTNLVFTSKTDPSSSFTGTLGNLAISTGSFNWP